MYDIYIKEKNAVERLHDAYISWNMKMKWIKINWVTGPLKKESKARIRNGSWEATCQNSESLP